MAVNNTEKRIAKLENELKALKAICPISGSMAKMYVQTSQEFTVGGAATLHDIEIGFTPTYTQDGNSLTTLYPVVTSTYLGYTYIRNDGFVVEPQSNSGVVVVKIYDVVDTDKVEVIASGASPGTFTRIS